VKFKKGNMIGRETRFGGPRGNTPAKGAGRNPISDAVRKMRAEGMRVPSYSDVQEVFLFLISLPLEEVRKIIEDETKPLLMRVIARELVGSKTGMEAAKYILERVYGKPTQVTENYNENSDIDERPKVVIVKNSEDE
jgi:hypothetical protein